MARRAIDGCFLEFVAVDAKSHGHVDRPHRHRALAHVTVAGGAVHTGAKMRRVIEIDVRRSGIIVDALPGDIFASLQICGHFLDFRFVRRDNLVASHAEVDAWDARVRPFIHADVAVRAVESVRKVNFVRERDGLHRLRVTAEEFHHRIAKIPVCGSKDGRALLGILVLGQ